MGYSQAALRLRTPEIKQLGRASDRISFLFMDKCRIEQTRTGVEAWQEEDGQLWKTTIPASNLAVLALGPGVSITTPALTTLYRNGTTVIISNSDGMRPEYIGRPLTATAAWAGAQARIWSDQNRRIDAARFLYQARFPTQPLPPETPIRVLRGLEGQQVKSTYQRLARKHRIKGFKRDTTASDPVNTSLNLGNAILYGLAATVCGALGLSPALGFIHEGNARALLFDLADVYKITLTLPIAFASADQTNPTEWAAKKLREEIHSNQTLSNLFELTQDLLDPDPPEHRPPPEDALLDDLGFVEGHRNWGID